MEVDFKESTKGDMDINRPFGFRPAQTNPGPHTLLFEGSDNINPLPKRVATPIIEISVLDIVVCVRFIQVVYNGRRAERKPTLVCESHVMLVYTILSAKSCCGDVAPRR